MERKNKTLLSSPGEDDEDDDQQAVSNLPLFSLLQDLDVRECNEGISMELMVLDATLPKPGTRF